MTKPEVIQAYQRNIEELTAQNPHAQVRVLHIPANSTFARLYEHGSFLRKAQKRFEVFPCTSRRTRLVAHEALK